MRMRTREETKSSALEAQLCSGQCRLGRPCLPATAGKQCSAHI